MRSISTCLTYSGAVVFTLITLSTLVKVQEEEEEETVQEEEEEEEETVFIRGVNTNED